MTENFTVVNVDVQRATDVSVVQWKRQHIGSTATGPLSHGPPRLWVADCRAGVVWSAV